MSRAQLRALGASDQAIARRVRAGRLHRIHPGVYAVGHTVLRREGHWIAAVLACGPGAVLSHRDAAALWGLWRASHRRIEVTVPRGNARRSTKEIAIRHARRPVEVAVVEAIPVTTVARTLADLAEVVSREALEKACEQADAMRLLDLRAVEAVAAAQPGRAGPTRVRELLRVHDVEHSTRSGLERAFLALCRRSGLPRPAVNARVAGHEVDFHWPAARVIVETDTYRFHGTPAAFAADRARDRALAAAGWLVVRATDDDVYRDAARLAALVVELLSARSRSPATP